MKKKLPFLMISLILFICSILSSCQYDSPKSIVGAQLNDRGELILTYSDDTTQNLGVVKGENGKDGKDGVDLTPCAHTYGDWQTQLAPSCTSIGYATRSCSLCGDLDYLITNPSGHTYENPVDLVHTCQQHFLNKTCITCGDTALVEEPATKDHFYGDWKTVEEYACGAIKQEKSCIYCNEKQIQTLNFSAHTFDENTLCTTCGHQEFIQSEEYMEEIPTFTVGYGNPVPTTGTLWWNKDRTYGLIILAGSYSASFKSYVGTPVHVQLPAYFNGVPFIRIDQPKGWSEEGTFKNCTTLKSIYIPDTVTRIGDYAFDGCTNLETVRFSENLDEIGKGAFRNCISLKILYFKNNHRILSHTYDYRYDPTFENCLSLTEIYFPLSYDMSGSTNAFSSCTALKKIYVSAERYETYVKRFKNFPNNLEIIIYE